MEEIINKQKEFQDLLGNDVKKQEFITMCVMGILEEAVETLKETPFKKHRKKQDFNRVNFITELADVQIYLLNLLLSVDVSFDEFKEIISKKQDKNFDRQKNGY